MILYDMMKIYYTHIANVTIESEAWVMGHWQLKADWKRIVSSLDRRHLWIQTVELSHGYSGSEGQRCGSQSSHGNIRQIWSVTHLISGGWRSGVSGMGGSY